MQACPAASPTAWRSENRAPLRGELEDRNSQPEGSAEGSKLRRRPSAKFEVERVLVPALSAEEALASLEPTPRLAPGILPDRRVTTRSIVILKPSSFGDIIHTLPSLAALRRAFPQAHLSWVVNAEWVPLLEEIPLLDAIRVFPRHRFRGLGGLLKFRRWLREEPKKWGADQVLDFQGLLRSGLISRAIGAPEVIGLSDSREGARLFHSRVVRVEKTMHSVDRYLALAAAAGGRTDVVEWPLRAGRPLSGQAIPPEPFVALHPFSRGEGKSLPPTAVAELCRLLAPRKVVLLGRGRIAGQEWPENTTDLLDQTKLDELIWVLRQAAFTISVDSGPMHLAAAISPRVLGIHTWTDPRKVGPYPKDALVWKGGRVVRVGNLAAQEPGWFERGEMPDGEALRTIAQKAGPPMPSD